MDRGELVRTAAALPSVAPDVIDEYRTRRPALVAAVNERMAARADAEALVGEQNLELMRDNHANHALFVESWLTQPQAEVLVDTALWVFRAYRSRGFSSSYWAAQLRTWLEVLERELTPPAFGAVEPLYRWFVIGIPHFVAVADQQLAAADPAGPEHTPGV